MVNFNILNNTAFVVANGVSVLVCLLAAILVLRLKLYKKTRVPIDSLSSTVASSTAMVVMVIRDMVIWPVMCIGDTFINYDDSPNIYGRICTVFGFLTLYTEWMKLLFTMWVTFHLFCFAVLHKNLKKLEVLYVVTSLLVPALIAAFPLITHTYGLNPGDNVLHLRG